jgi:CHAD domain-containing protein
MIFQLLADETVETGIKRILQDLLTETINLLADPGDNPDKSVHNARKNCKRLRAVLRLVRDTLGYETYRLENIAIRDASRRLAPMRDSAVLIETLDRLTTHFDQPEGTFSNMRAQLVLDYEATHDRFWNDTAVIHEVIDVLQAVQTNVSQFELPADDFSSLSGGLLRVYQRGLFGMKRSYKSGSIEAFHNWRKRVKYLWHQLEILRGAWPLVLDETAAELHRLSSHLGEAHDLAVLLETMHTAPDKYGSAADITALTELATDYMHRLEEEARPLGHRLYAEKPKAFVTRIGAYWQVWHDTGYNGLNKAPALRSTRDVAAARGIPLTAVRDLIRSGQITAVKIGQQWVVLE